MDYIETHRTEFEAEYQWVVQKDEELRQYYDAQTQKIRAQIASRPPKPGQEQIRAKLQAWKEELGVA